MSRLICALTFLIGFLPYDLVSQSFSFDSTEMVAFLDGMIETRMKDQHIAGATLSIVHNGKIFIQKGYGYADVETKKPVDPNRTLFRIGSISKLFPWLAIMQLQEQNLVDLSTDIKEYVPDLLIPENYDESITIKHLMTHTAGFEDEIFGLFGQTAESMRPYEELLKDEMPARVRPPGTYASYSNHGTGMAAYIVEKISGMPFNQYVEQNITEPLGMNSFSFDQPLPAGLEEHMSKGYTYSSGKYNEEGFEYVPLAAVGGASASANAMATFMLACLNRGTYGGATILEPSTYGLMTTNAHRHHPAVNGMFYGFMESSRNGVLAYGHGGDTFWFHSMMAVLPEKDFGIFLSFNSEAGAGVKGDVWKDFMDHYFPAELSSLPLPNQEDLKRFEGEYMANRYSHDDLLKVAQFMSGIDVTSDKDGYLITGSDDPDYWIMEEELVFRNRDNASRIVFEEDTDGKIARAFLSNAPIIAFDKHEGIQKTSFHYMLMAITGIVFGLSLIYWFFKFIFRRRLNAMQPMEGHTPRLIRRLLILSIILVLVFYVQFIIMAGNGNEIVYGIPLVNQVLFGLTIVVTILTLVLTVLILKMWMQKYGAVHLISKIGATVVWLCLIITVWQWNYWNMLGWQFG